MTGMVKINPYNLFSTNLNIAICILVVVSKLILLNIFILATLFVPKAYGYTN